MTSRARETLSTFSHEHLQTQKLWVHCPSPPRTPVSPRMGPSDGFAVNILEGQAVWGSVQSPANCNPRYMLECGVLPRSHARTSREGRGTLNPRLCGEPRVVGSDLLVKSSLSHPPRFLLSSGHSSEVGHSLPCKRPMRWVPLTPRSPMPFPGPLQQVPGLSRGHYTPHSQTPSSAASLCKLQGPRAWRDLLGPLFRWGVLTGAVNLL